jgi:hypothetical protein
MAAPVGGPAAGALAVARVVRGARVRAAPAGSKVLK